MPPAEAPDTDMREQALLARMRAGEEGAYAELVTQYGGRMLAAVRRLLRNDADAQDAVQDAFLSAFQSIDRFEGTSRLSTWLHRIAINAALMKLRKRGTQAEQPIDAFLPGFLDDGHQAKPAQRWSAGAPAALEREETRQLVRRLIDQLPESYRIVLVLRDIEGMDTDQAAEALGVTATNVKTRLHRARLALRTLLDPYFRESRA